MYVYKEGMCVNVHEQAPSLDPGEYVLVLPFLTVMPVKEKNEPR